MNGIRENKKVDPVPFLTTDNDYLGVRDVFLISIELFAIDDTYAFETVGEDKSNVSFHGLLSKNSFNEICRDKAHIADEI